MTTFSDYTPQIVEHLATLSRLPNGWTIEANLVANPLVSRPELDIREWPADKRRMGRGITLNYYETQILLTSLLANSALLETLDREGDDYDESEQQ